MARHRHLSPVLVILSLAALIATEARAKEVTVEVKSVSSVNLKPGGGGRLDRIAGAEVGILLNGESHSGFTDGRGEFRLDLDNLGGLAEVTVTHPDYYPVRMRDVELDQLSRCRIDVYLRRNYLPKRTDPREGEQLIEIGGTKPEPAPNLALDDLSGLGDAFYQALRLHFDSLIGGNRLFLGNQLLGQGLLFELDEVARLEPAADNTFKRRISLLQNLLPAELEITYDATGNLLSFDLQPYSGALTDGNQRVGEVTIYPDGAGLTHRLHRDGLFERNLLFPPGQFFLGPANGGAQYQAALCADREEDDVIVIFGSYIEDPTEPVPDGSCQQIADTLTFRATGYNEFGDLLFDLELDRFEGKFGPGCNNPFPSSADYIGDNKVAVTYQSPENRLELKIIDMNLAQSQDPQSLELAVHDDSLQLLPYQGPPFNLATITDPVSGALLIATSATSRWKHTVDGQKIGIQAEEQQGPEEPVRPVNLLKFQNRGEWNLRFDIGWEDEGQIEQEPDSSLPLAYQSRHGPVVGVEDLVAVDQPGVTGGSVLRSTPDPGCADTPITLCLNDQRFAITSYYVTAQGEEGEGQARPLSNDSGTFWFFGPDNREVIAKLLDGCGVNGFFWFFAAGLTNVEVVLQVRDFAVGDGTIDGKVYVSPLGQTFQPILDTEAFPCAEGEQAKAREELARSPDQRASLASVAPALVPAHDLEAAKPAAAAPAEAVRRPTVADGTACGGDPEDLCLNDGRFRVEVDYTDFAGQTSPAFGGNLTDDTGALFFFDRSNVELLVKVLDACFLGNYWVFAAGLTNVGVDLTVTDTLSGQSATYRNPVRARFQPVTDTTTFDACP